ncbi:exodeoxyribonuclease VII large subunit [Amphibacillus sp. MSJ-3]|uniref:exodeoxyribonuclease VII large subunit n=1 Tax=Amphibacillus sp. MSJ-3 TaxID=2841505 RepID=UPI001C0F1278|nr:exodeoxyribonuclease VII large subunit [Amphibacillus sp. MSJ-3]MBU5594805.1 exodeoxyribonuclease VII large subunit [Amphibacillus sp. MSJ-3]
MSERYLTVTALTRYIKRKFELDKHLTTVWLKAEISNFKHHSRGHMYFTLKDDQSKILAVMFAGYNRSLRFQPEDGLHVIVKGEVGVYEPMGQYQIYVHDMIPDGVGALHLAFEQLKEKLAKEGLFEKAKKKPIPAFPEHIGVITSETGAAIRDVLTTLNRRYPIAKISVFPTLVQGEQAKYDLVKKIEQANQQVDLDILIIARGGGSIEELWPFNEEIVVRSVANSKIPVISGVGHETDSTMIDFVADCRAPTPTAAAELAVPLQIELIEKNNQFKRSLNREIKEGLAKKRERLNQIQKGYAFNYPKQLLVQKEQELDRLVETLQRNMERYLNHNKSIFYQLLSELKGQDPSQQINAYQQKNTYYFQTLQDRLKKVIDKKAYQFDTQVNKLHVLSPLNTMRRGYSVGYDKKGQLIKSVKEIAPGDQLKLQMIDGSLDCQVWGIEEDNHD